MSTPSFRYYDGPDRVPEPEFAKRRGRTVRSCRLERQRGVASPWVRDGRQIIYSWQKYLEHLERNERCPVREAIRARRSAEDRSTP
jgi:hypothetical protein